MPKTLVEGDSYIRVEREETYSWSPSLDDIRKSILRHVDGVTKNEVYIVVEQNPVCSFCGDKWTESSTLYNGGCCDRDEALRP